MKIRKVEPVEKWWKKWLCKVLQLNIKSAFVQMEEAKLTAPS